MLRGPQNLRICVKHQPELDERGYLCPGEIWLQVANSGTILICLCWVTLQKHIDFTKKPIVWILGGPRSGKKTQCEKIVARYGFLYLSTAELLRDQMNVSHHNVYLSDIISRGCLAPNEVILDLLKEHMEAGYESCKGFLIEGFPREWRQGPDFEKHIASPSVVIYLDTSHDTMVQRLKDHDQGSADDVAVEGFKPPEDDSIQYKIRTHAEHTGPILKHYEEQDKLRIINAEQTEEDVFIDVKEILDPLAPWVVRSNTTLKSTKSMKSVKSTKFAQPGPS